MSAAGADNYDDNSNAIEDRKLYILVLTLSVEDNQALSNFLAKDLKDHFTGIII